MYHFSDESLFWGVTLLGGSILSENELLGQLSMQNFATAAD